uniref:Small ribosomal subunit protein uS4c n=2 Tax=Ostreobium TaxID=121087 RepID=A0A1A8GYU1_9CHLO|nr:Ribosomal protein S4 [Ostreobium quekettii]ANG44415.1 ribosomal protein S4 [Ostreobium sp. OS1B]SBQ77041.1 Ribosomal protein S4 [Ostreobium quekettii]
MSRYTGPRFKIIRRLGKLPGLTRKVPLNKKQSLKKKSSQYGIRLETKQKLRFHYGVTEKQLVRYVKRARSLKGSTGKILIKLLEMRLDNIIFRVGLAPTIPAARQIINHGHVLVNNSKMNIPSYQCQLNDKISINKKDKNSSWLEKINDKNLEPGLTPSHLDFDIKTNNITILNNFQHDEVGLELNELLIVEYYSRS